MFLAEWCRVNKWGICTYILLSAHISTVRIVVFTFLVFLRAFVFFFSIFHPFLFTFKAAPQLRPSELALTLQAQLHVECWSRVDVWHVWLVWLVWLGSRPWQSTAVLDQGLAALRSVGAHTMFKSRNTSNRFACMDTGDEFGCDNTQRTCACLHVAVFQRAAHCPSFQARWKLPT